MSDTLRAPLIRHFETLATDVAIGRHGDPHVAFVVFVYPDSEPSVVAVTPSRSPRNLSTLRAGKGDEKAETTGERFFTYEDLYDAYSALNAARWAMQIHHLRSKGGLTLGAEIIETIRERWQRHKDAPIMRAMAEAQHLAEHPHVCTCKRRFRTGRGLGMHIARTTHGTHGLDVS